MAAPASAVSEAEPHTDEASSTQVWPAQHAGPAEGATRPACGAGLAECISKTGRVVHPAPDPSGLPSEPFALSGESDLRRTLGWDAKKQLVAAAIELGPSRVSRLTTPTHSPTSRQPYSQGGPRASLKG